MCNDINTLKNNTETLINNFDLNSLASAMIGGVFVFLGIMLTEYFIRQRATKEEENKTVNFLKDIKEEINILFELYNRNMGDCVENHIESTPFNYIYIVNQEYFTIYTNNSNILGNVKNDAIRISIIKSYSKAKALIDTFQLNNAMLEKFEIAVSTDNKPFIEAYTKVLSDYSASITFLHHDLKDEISTLNHLLKDEDI